MQFNSDLLIHIGYFPSCNFYIKPLGLFTKTKMYRVESINLVFTLSL